MRSADLRTRPDDGALLFRARRLAQRSRAATACLLCKANKSKCSDFRPCSRCRRLGIKVCADLQSELLAEIEPPNTHDASDKRDQSNNASLGTDLSINVNPFSSWPGVTDAPFVHCGSDMTKREPMFQGLQEAMPTDNKVISR